MRLARKQHGVFSRRQAIEVGATPALIYRRAKAGRWRRVAPGVYAIPAWERTMKQRVMAAVLQVPGSAASHRCAALLHRLDGVRAAPIEITIPRSSGGSPVQVTIHRSDDLIADDVVVVDGIPTTSITRTLVDISSHMRLTDLECAYEDGVRRGETSLAELEAFVSRIARPGRRGVGGARRLIDIALRDGKRNGSALETRFLQILRRLGLPAPVRQCQIFRPDGRFAYADYAYEEHQVVFELQGYEGHSKKLDHRRDTERNNMLQLRGYRLFEFTWHHVMNEPDKVAGVVLAALGMQTLGQRAGNAQEKTSPSAGG